METRKIKIQGNGKVTGKMSPQEVTFVAGLYSAIFRRELWTPKCSSCAGTFNTLVAMIKKLDIVYVNSF